MNARKMITRADIEREIIRRYIAPTRKKRADYIGVEFELPIVNKKKQAVDFHVVHAMTESFAKEFGFTDFRYDDEGNICAAQDPPTQDDLSFDCSYNTLEFSFGREQNLNVIHQRFQSYISYINQFLGEHNHCATGMGINPYCKYNEITPVPNGRYRMLLHHLSSYEKYADQMLFHNIPYYGLIACSAQTHINAHEQNLPETINLFNMLEPLKALLFANSPSGDYLCLRDHLWRESMHGLNPHNVDCWNIHVDSVEEIAAYIRSMSLYCTERDGKYINFAPVPLDEYFASDSIEGEYYDGGLYRHITWEPELSDLQYLRSFKFVDLTFRGTLELRSACMQPVSEAMTVPAFHLGLACEMDRVRKILDDISIYRQGYTIAELRKQFVMRSLPAFADKTELQDALVQLVETAQAGLQRRGLGEEALLRPLKRRAAAMKSPALEVMEGLEAGRSLEEYMRDIEKNICKIALVQAEPVMFEKEASLKKAIEYIYVSAKNNAELIVFPELFIPGYPIGMNFGFSMGKRTESGREDWMRYCNASVVEGDIEFEQLSAAAKETKTYVSIGFSERDSVNGTLYNSNAIFEPNGSYKVHRKLKPTGSERMVWGDANRGYFPITETPWGPIGSLICWESYMPLARVALYQKGISIYISPNTNDNPEWQSTIQHIAIEGKCYFINADMIVKKSSYPKNLNEHSVVDNLPDTVCRGGSCIIDPFGHYVTEPVWEDETIIYADLDMSLPARCKMEHDAVGHYARPDVLVLNVTDL